MSDRVVSFGDRCDGSVGSLELDQITTLLGASLRPIDWSAQPLVGSEVH